MAVDLARREVGDAPAGRRGIRLLELGVALVDVEGAGEGGRRVDRRVAQAGEPGEQQVDLELRALDVGLGLDGVGARRGEQPVEHGGRAAGDERRDPWPCRGRPLPPAHVTSPVEGSTDCTSAPVMIVAPAETRRCWQGSR